MVEVVTKPAGPEAVPAAPTGVGVSVGAATRTWPLLLAVLVCGAGSMTLEMSASRLLAPHFGSSLYIWAILIGLVMIFLASGYSIGGRLADRAPRPALLYGIIAAVGLLIALIPLISGPVLSASEQLSDGTLALDPGAGIAVIALFMLPVTLLGCVSPFAVRLRISEVGAAGRTAGSLYALSTLGSILGTFVPVFLLMPYLGIAVTLYLSGISLLAVAGIGLLAGRSNPPATFPTRVVEDRLPSARMTAARRGVGAEVVAVGVAGLCLMILEMTASQLLRPYFGNSLFIWATLIGLVMIYLTVGYFLGGRLADRYPSVRVFYGLLVAAGIATAIIPTLAQPLLTWSLEGFSQISVSIFYGALAGVIGLFAVPMILLGCVSPFAIRLRMRDPDAAGRTAGSIYALSTFGSIFGTFIPVFLLLPNIGSGRTLLLAAGALMLTVTLGLYASGKPGARLAAAGLLAVAALGLLPPPSLIKPPPYGSLLAERESVYNYIQVVQRDNGDVHLVLNEGHAVHSIYRADQAHPLTGGPWDYWLVAPYVNAGKRPADVHNMLMLGSAAGTAAELFTRVYGPKPVDDVEIDPEIVKLGRQYFHLDSPNINNIVRDARVYLRTTDKKYSIVGIDAYRQPYIPFHLTTREFFQEARDRLEPGGVAMINAGRAGKDYRLVNAIAATMRSVFPHVYIIDVAAGGNSMVIGTEQAGGISNFGANAAAATDPLLRQVFAASLDHGNMREVQPASVTGDPVFTDDRAPVEEVIDQLILSYVTGK
ncbi:MAG: fused MFS/spermidine synthase [Chloroflexia bacterium]